MKIKNFMILLGVLAIFVLLGCAQQQTKYVCSDGTTVSDSSFCPEKIKELKRLKLMEKEKYWEGKIHGACPSGESSECKSQVNFNPTRLNLWFEVESFISQSEYSQYADVPFTINCALECIDKKCVTHLCSSAGKR